MFLNRLSFILALLGMVLALHLWIQKERNFDQGCWGIGQISAASASSGCNDQEFKKHSEFLGLSVATWGYGFYFTLALLGFGKILLRESGARRCQTASEAIVFLAFPFALYLVWIQAFVAKAFCPLCLISSGIVTVLFAIHGWQFWREAFSPISESERIREVGFASVVAFAATGLFAALLVIVNQVGSRRLDQGENVPQFEAMLGRALPKYIEPAKLAELKPALYNPDLAPLDLSTWATGELPALGTGTGVSLVAFLDPNCPSCKFSYANLRLLADRYHDRLQVQVISRTLWEYSELQSQALELAAQAGKYHEMWQLQFDHAKKGGMQLSDLTELFHKLGLDTRDLEMRLDAVRPKVLARKDRAVAAGVRGTPTLYINGRAVASGSNDPSSLGKLVEQALAAAPQPR